MTEVVSVRFKDKGKTYYFEPNGLQVKDGDKVVVETSKGMELAMCAYGNHYVPDDKIVPPIRPVVRLATEQDLRVAESNKAREKEAFGICQKKIAEHELDMKLVDVECNFEGNKIIFFFTSDGRVDFRELVKDLASVFRTRIELRQIGVRDEAKLLGGLGICGRPFCCHQFLDEFQPVSTKMAKIQSLSLNPTKISGSCGRLMCCLRYEQEAYEELTKRAPKNGAFVETAMGYGNVIQVNLLRQQVKVKLDGEGEDIIKTCPVDEIAVIPGGRPKDGEPLPHLLQVKPKEEKAEEEDPWMLPVLFADEMPKETKPEEVRENEGEGQKKRRRSRGSKGKGKSGENGGQKSAEKQDKPKAEGQKQPRQQDKEKGEENKPRQSGRRNRGQGKKPAGEEPRNKGQHHGDGENPARPPKGKSGGERGNRPKPQNPDKTRAPKTEGGEKPQNGQKKSGNRNGRWHRGKPKAKPEGGAPQA